MRAEGECPPASVGPLFFQSDHRGGLRSKTHRRVRPAGFVPAAAPAAGRAPDPAHPPSPAPRLPAPLLQDTPRGGPPPNTPPAPPAGGVPPRGGAGAGTGP